MRYVCSVCGYVYDEEREGKPFSELPESWKCPVCKAAKPLFAPDAPADVPAPAAEPAVSAAASGEEYAGLTVGELAALCSNLARGCEKQYNATAQALFTELAGYFSAVSPEHESPTVERLAEMLRADLGVRYPNMQAAASAAGDRGLQRVRVWGEKVTNMLSSLVAQYMSEGEAMLRGTDIWVCSVCGFVYIGGRPPELCPVCKVPAWKFDKIEGRASA